MTQAFYNAISGINASQSQLVVVSDNIANMNTTGFKGSRVTFADVYYNTISAGSPPTKEVGGTNGKQIGLGVQIASIDRDFTNGTVTSTGINTDCNIQGNGFFVVQGASGENYYTRAGNFTVDSEGYLTLPNGYRVVGATNVFSTTASDKPLQIPNMISTETVANTVDLTTKKLEDLDYVELQKNFFVTIDSENKLSAYNYSDFENACIASYPLETEEYKYTYVRVTDDYDIVVIDEAGLQQTISPALY